MIVIFLILCSMLIILHAQYITHYTPSKTLNEVYYNLAETGDIVYFRWKDVAFTHELISPFTHIGLIIIDPDTDKRYIVETHLAGDGKKLGVYEGGINVYPLKERLEKYEGHTFLTKLKYRRPDNIDVNEFLSNVEKFQTEIPFHDEYTEYFTRNCLTKRVCKDCFDIEKKAGMFCSEFIAFCLKELSIVPPDFDHECLAPGDFRYVQHVNGDYLYDDLIRIRKN